GGFYLWNPEAAANEPDYYGSGTNGQIWSVALEPKKGSFVVFSGEDGLVRVWDMKEKVLSNPKALVKYTNAVGRIAFAPDGREVRPGGEDKPARLWDAAGKQLYVFRGHNGPVRSVTFARDGRRILTGSADKTVRYWDVLTGRTLGVFRGHTGDVTSVV